MWCSVRFEPRWSFLGRDPMEVMLCPARCLISGVHDACVSSLVMLTLVTCLRCCLPGSPLSSSYLSFLINTCLEEGTLRPCKFCFFSNVRPLILASIGRSCPQQLIVWCLLNDHFLFSFMLINRNLTVRKNFPFSPFIYWIDCLYQYGLMGRCCNLCIMIQYYHYFFCCINWPIIFITS